MNKKNIIVKYKINLEAASFALVASAALLVVSLVTSKASAK
jgi:hypothetical protein